MSSWTTQTEAASAISTWVDAIAGACPWTTTFSHRLRNETSTRLIDWVHALDLPTSLVGDNALTALGFRRGDDDRWRHPGARLPAIGRDRRQRLILGVEDVTACCSALDLEVSLSDGIAILATTTTTETICLGRSRWGGIPHATDSSRLLDHGEVLDLFRLRRRIWTDPAEGFRATEALIRQAVRKVGVEVACEAFFAAERERWQRHNRAAAWQRWRQDRLGLGWANHDHHTFRSSRDCFAPLIRCLEALGLVCRERFHAGAEAGWGAQVLEHPLLGIAVFADVDLSPDEIADDPGHQGLAPRRDLGTVGLWCALHGESFFEAGLHHLACLGDFDALRAGLDQGGHACMAPFTTFPYLRQCFTQGESWTPTSERLHALVQAGRLDRSNAERMAREGARGSHLELIERNEGFKGFNQHGVSAIISATDPRK